MRILNLHAFYILQLYEYIIDTKQFMWMAIYYSNIWWCTIVLQRKLVDINFHSSDNLYFAPWYISLAAAQSHMHDRSEECPHTHTCSEYRYLEHNILKNQIKFIVYFEILF